MATKSSITLIAMCMTSITSIRTAQATQMANRIRTSIGTSRCGTRIHIILTYIIDMAIPPDSARSGISPDQTAQIWLGNRKKRIAEDGGDCMESITGSNFDSRPSP